MSRIRGLKPGERRRIDRGIYARGHLDGSVVYGIRYRHRGRDIREDVGPTVTLARQALAVRKAEIAQGRFGFPASRRIPTFAKFSQQYLAHAATEKRSWRLDESRIHLMCAAFGEKRLDSITSWDVEQYKAARRLRVSKRTVNIELAILSRMFVLARTWGVTTANPLAGVSRYREEQLAVRILTADEETRLMQALPEHLRDLVILALNTGLRLGELRALRSEDVDLEAGMLRVTAAKTGRLRGVPMNRPARDVVQRGLARGTSSILSYRGRPLGRIYRAWYRACRDASVRGLRVHDLRHTFASRLLAKGADLATVRDLLGHSGFAMTARYLHTSTEAKRAATAKLER